MPTIFSTSKIEHIITYHWSRLYSHLKQWLGPSICVTNEIVKLVKERGDGDVCSPQVLTDLASKMTSAGPVQQMMAQMGAATKVPFDLL